MLAKGDRLTLPAFGVGGDWIVKLPDQTYPDVPRNEFTMMSLAASVGIAVPPVRLVHRDELDGLPPDVWTSREEWAYAIRRFDRDAHRDSVHIEDLAQVRNVYPEDKYLGNYETVARGRGRTGTGAMTARAGWSGPGCRRRCGVWRRCAGGTRVNPHTDLTPTRRREPGRE